MIKLKPQKVARPTGGLEMPDPPASRLKRVARPTGGLEITYRRITHGT